MLICNFYNLPQDSDGALQPILQSTCANLKTVCIAQCLITFLSHLRVGFPFRILLNEEEALFHRPHPQKETDKGAVVSVRRFLENAGVKLC